MDAVTYIPWKMSSIDNIQIALRKLTETRYECTKCNQVVRNSCIDHKHFFKFRNRENSNQFQLRQNSRNITVENSYRWSFIGISRG